MYGGQHRDGFLSDINPGEDHGRLRDAGQALLELFRRQVVQLQVHVVFLRTTTATYGCTMWNKNPTLSLTQSTNPYIHLTNIDRPPVYHTYFYIMTVGKRLQSITDITVSCCQIVAYGRISHKVKSDHLLYFIPRY